MNIDTTSILSLLEICYPHNVQQTSYEKGRTIFIKTPGKLFARKMEEQRSDEKKASFEQITQWAIAAMNKSESKLAFELSSKRLRWIANHTAEKHFGNNFMGRLKQLFSRCLGFITGKGFCTPVDTVLKFCEMTPK